MAPLRRFGRDAVDRLLEAPVVPSFTSLGPLVRSRVDGWTPLDSYDLTGRTVMVTGATSGLGRAAAVRLGSLGADLVLLGRSDAKLADAVAEVETAGAGDVHAVRADMGELDQVRTAAEWVLAERPCIDALVHNAGALTAEHRLTSSGYEATVASQVTGPFLLTGLLLPTLRAAAPGRVLTMSSGGLYATGLAVESLEMSPDTYRGSEQYARAKRAQVTLNEMWSERIPPTDVVFHALHPGWADTPGVAESLPRFRRVVGPALRTPEQGIDTLVWLIADDAGAATTGGFWHDRRTRPIHKLPVTRRSDTPDRRARLWDQVAARAGIDPA